jgi:hypothetical protein
MEPTQSTVRSLEEMVPGAAGVSRATTASMRMIATLKGRLIQKIQRQLPLCANAPPMIGPVMAPTAHLRRSQNQRHRVTDRNTYAAPRNALHLFRAAVDTRSDTMRFDRDQMPPAPIP